MTQTKQKAGTSHLYSLLEVETGRTITARLEEADTFLRRAIGLMGRNSLSEDAGLWIEPCNGIHTFGLRFPIDVLFLDKSGKILRLYTNVPPRRIVWPVKGTRTTLELPAGTIQRASLQVGKTCRKIPSNTSSPSTA